MVCGLDLHRTTIHRPHVASAWTASLTELFTPRPPCASDGGGGPALHLPRVSEFAIVDWDPEGVDLVLTIVDDRAETEENAIDLRRAGIQADIVPSAPERDRW
jgi:hypothetical protein